jgi:hypothetical protein
MPIKVTVNSPGQNRISINRTGVRSTVRSLAITTAIEGQSGGGGVDTLSELTDVDATDSDNNEVLVWDQASGKYVIKVLPVLDGGEY